MSANYVFREIDSLTKFLKVLLGLGVWVAVVSLMSSIMQAKLLYHGSFTEAEVQSNYTREQMIWLFRLALYLFTAVMFGLWIVRANKNVRALGAEGLRITPGWAVGYFFIPIVNLWRPYQAMNDLWRASHNPSSWAATAASFILPAWWTLWLLTHFLGQMSFQATMAAEGLVGLQASTYVQMVSHAVDIPLSLVAMALVAQIANAQKTHLHTST